MKVRIVNGCVTRGGPKRVNDIYEGPDAAMLVRNGRAVEIDPVETETVVDESAIEYKSQSGRKFTTSSKAPKKPEPMQNIALGEAEVPKKKAKKKARNASGK